MDKVTNLSVNLREDETVTVQPVGVLGVEVHELVEQNVSNWGHSPVEMKSVCILYRPVAGVNSQGSTRVARVTVSGRIGLLSSLVLLVLSCDSHTRSC